VAARTGSVRLEKRPPLELGLRVRLGLRLGLGVGLQPGLLPALDWGSSLKASCHPEAPGDGFHSRSGRLDSLILSSDAKKSWHLSSHSG
jgi:hypothetical protein